MSKTFLAVIAFLVFSQHSFSQTLFTYGNQSVSADEFLKAYHKNNTQPVADKHKAMKDYLDLYINSKLKVQEAYDRRYDTLPQVKVEVNNLRNQIIESYMSDPETMNRLTKEAFQRSLKDIHVGHIFVPVANNDDTASARAKIDAAYSRLQKGENFSAVAVQTSADPGVAANKGDIGWITVFTLPYSIENIIYAIPAGKISPVIHSKAGYHIFKNLGERPAVGKMKAKQILLAFPPGSDDAAKKQIANRADSIYKRIMAGEDFSKLASMFSNDYLTSITGGSMPDFGVGQFDPVFESKVWALKKDGEVSKPFLTAHGWHIVKRSSAVPVVTDPADKTNEQGLRQRINQDQRWVASREVIYKKVIKEAGLKKADYNDAVLWAFSDSLIDRKPAGAGNTITDQTVVFTLGDSILKAGDWINYARGNRYKTNGSGLKKYDELRDEFANAVAFKYYRDHLERFNSDFRDQMNEFKDGNLFFEIMQREIWNRSNSDTAELRALFNANKHKYNWAQSADAVIFFCSNKDVAQKLHDQVKKTPSKWSEYVDALTEQVVIDSARFEWAQIPNKNKMLPVAGMITTPVVNTTDNTVSFAYVIKVYPKPMPRTFEEAKGLVVNDYQNVLEAQWVKQLKEKYPVTVNEKLFQEISK